MSDEDAAPAPLLVQGIPPRDTIVTFTQHYASYNAGESAAFTSEEAARLRELSVIGEDTVVEPVAATATPTQRRQRT